MLFAIFTAGQGVAQTIPVGLPVTEEAYRQAQLLGNADSTVSFTIRPLFPDSRQKKELNSFERIGKVQGTVTNGDLYFGKNKEVVVSLLPFTWQQQYTSHHPYSLNDGVMIPARGYQTMISGGFYARYGHLSLQLRPEYIYAQNRNFQGFYKEHPDEVWAEYYRTLNTIDLPEKFGDAPYNRLKWGQSSIRLTYGAFSAGISSENLWWGPGIRNSFNMSNNAPGFMHITFNTVRPIKTYFGTFESQIVCGKLENSGYTPPDTSRTFNGSRLYLAKREDWRYLNGMVLSYQPKWIPGLFLGVTRTFITYYKDMGHNLLEFLPIISPVTKKANYGEKESVYANDQRASVFIRWLWQKERAEFYWEYGREDHAYNLRDLLIQPDHTRAYIVGFKKLLPLYAHQNQYIQFNLEVTQLAQTGTNPERPTGSIYLHYAGISQGYTHSGQLLGAGIGPGSNMQMAGISWVNALKSIGLEAERTVHNNDFQTTAIRDIRAKWVDFAVTAFGNWDWKNLLFSAKFSMINSYNYQYRYIPVKSLHPSYWTPGNNTFNYQTLVGVTYRF